jgi:hypothetical protein
VQEPPGFRRLSVFSARSQVRDSILHPAEHHRAGALFPALEQTREELKSTQVDCVML